MAAGVLTAGSTDNAIHCVVRAVELEKWYDDRPILRDINLDIAPGGFLALLGANGAGKSTLLKILATLLPPSKGELKLFDQPANSNPIAIRGRIGVISHQPILYRDLTVLENLEFFGKLYGVAHATERALELLEAVRLRHRALEPVRNLSRGMSQRVSIARALMHNPPLLLADEPFAGLDAPSTDDLEKLLTQLHEDGRTIILSNHDLAQSLRLARHAIVLRQGRVVIDRPTSRLTAAEVLREVAGG